MNRILSVARREYIEHVKTRSFIVGIVLLPLLIAGSTLIQNALEKTGGKTGRVVLIDGGGMGEAIAALYGAGERYPLEVRTAGPAELEPIVERLSAEVRAKELVAFLVVEAGLIGGDGEARFYTDNLSREEPRGSLMRALTQVVQRARIQERGLEEGVVQEIFSPVPTREFNLAKEGATEVSAKAREAGQFIPMIFVYFMFIGIMSQAQSMLTSTVEEKSNRVMEVLLSSVSPFQLMAGKIIGLALVSLTLFAVWMGGGAFMIVRFNLESMIQFSTLGYFLLFLFLGFLLYSSVMAALGSLCNDLKEAQNMMTPVMMIMFIPLAIMFWVGKNPDHILGQVLSFIPVFTPFLMINRIASVLPPGPFEIILSLVVLAAGIWITVWLAARVFRVGVLLYGKPPAPREVLRWLREA